MFTFLAPYDNSGRPSNIISGPSRPDLVEESLQQLPPGQHIHDHFLRPSDIHIEAPCELSALFIHEGAGYKNCLSYYVYDLNAPPRKLSEIKEVFVIFPHAATDVLQSGESVRLAYKALNATRYSEVKQVATELDYTFPAGVGVGFLIHANQWRNGEMRLGHVMYAADQSLNREPKEDLRYHAVAYRSKVDPEMLIIGFEDCLRTRAWCDHDFNDLLISIQASAIDAIRPRYVDLRGYDTQEGTFLCEDGETDSDYNDFSGEYYIHKDFNAKTITFTIKGVARGALYWHKFGVVIHGVTGKQATRDGNELFTLDSDHVDLIPNTHTFLPEGSTWATNTIDGTTEVHPALSTLTIHDIDPSYDTYVFYLKCYRLKHYKWKFYSDQLYPTLHQAYLDAKIPLKKKILILPGILNMRFPKERIGLHKVYPYLLRALSGDGRYAAWHLTCKDYLTYPRTLF